MASNYPASKDSFPLHTDNNNEDVKASDMNNVQDSILQLEQTLGYGSTQPTNEQTPNTVMKRDPNGNITALGVSGLTGATTASRYVGGTPGGAPTTGTFQVTDWCLDATGTIWICTAAGSPGTWVQVNNPSISIKPNTMVLRDQYGSVKGYKPNFRVTPATNQSITAGTLTKIAFGTVVFDDNTNWSTNTYRFVAAVPGTYFFDANIEVLSVGAGASVELVFEKNGVGDTAPFLVNNGSSVANMIVNGSTQIHMNANDYVDLWIQVSAGTSLAISTGSGSRFSGFMVKAD